MKRSFPDGTYLTPDNGALTTESLVYTKAITSCDNSIKQGHCSESGNSLSAFGETKRTTGTKANAIPS